MSEILAPAWLNKSELHLPTGQKNALVFALPDNRIHTTINRRLDQESGDIIGRAGISAVMDFRDNNRQYCFEWIHSNIMANAGKPPGQPFGPSSLSQQDIINVSNTVGTGFMEANELGEGDPWGMPYYLDQKRWWYQARKAAYQAANKPYRDYGTYGGFENFNGDPWLFKTGGSTDVLPNANNAPFKGYIQTLSGARNSCDYFNLFEPIGVGAIIKNYADTPDYAPDYYRKKFAAEVMGKGGGRVGGLGGSPLAYLDWGNYEGLGETGPGSLHNGIFYERTKPDGTVLTGQYHPAVDFDWLMACGFCIGFCMTDGCIPFNERTRYSSNPADNNYPMEALSYQDSTFEAAYRYAQTARTAGQPWQYARYRFAGSEQWIEPKTDGTTILDHASAFGGPYAKGNSRRGRPDVMFRVKNNALDFWAFDPSRGMESTETIIVEPISGHSYSIDLRGGKLRQFSETI
jgi:hypothetical protein